MKHGIRDQELPFKLPRLMLKTHKMAESVTETGGFTQDLFSPLQFCEVVEEGQQQRQQHLNQQQSHQQHLQQMHQHQAHLNQQQITTLQTAQPTHHHHQQQQNNQPQLQNPTQLQQQQPPPPQSQQQSVKQETSQQAVQSQLLNSPDTKTQSLMNGVSGMEIFLAAPNPLHLQTVSSPLVAIHQQHLPQPMYQVHLSRQQQTIDLTRHTHPTLQQLQLGGLHLQGQPHTPNIQISQQTHRSQEVQPPPLPMGVGAIVNVGSTESFALPVNSTTTSTKPPSTNAVATQTTPTDGSHLEDDEPEIIFTSVPNVTTESSTVTLSINPSNDTGPLSEAPKISNGSANVSDGNTEMKPVPVKRTWRRPWKKKKEREKRQPVKKVRRMKRRRVVIPKKNVVHIDPRHGPPIDTSSTLVERESEETINQLKQKRQRIKLNRNSGREYVNRLGKVVRARKIGTPCNCPLKCWDRMGSKILDIFNNFWDLCDFNLQNSYLFTCLKLCDVKRRYTKKQPAEESRRQNTFEYFVRISGKHLRVCKKAFMSSHGLTSDKRLRTLFSQMKDGALIPEPDRRGKHLRPTKGPGSNGHGVLTQNAHTTSTPTHTNNHHNNNNNSIAGSHTKSSGRTKAGTRGSKKKPPSAPHRNMDAAKQAMYTPPAHAVAHLHPHCTPPPPAHGTPMQEPPHAYIPNGEIYLPGHYLEPPQAMAPPHMNQIPSCQKMIEPPAYFMAGMRENTFHQ